MKSALVTGASGMLGSYIVKRLHADGWCVAALVRDPAKSAWVEEIGGTLVQGDILDVSSLTRAAMGRDVVFHTAAAIGTGDNPGSIWTGNVVGTANLVQAATIAGARVVHISTTSVFGRDRYHEKPTDESSPLPKLPQIDVYGRSKQDAEKIILSAHSRGRIWGCIIRPPVMYGRHDRQFLPRIAPLLRRGIFPLIGGGHTTLTVVHASSVADGAVRAATRFSAGGKIYHLTNDFELTLAAFVALAEQGLGRRIKTVDVPIRIGQAGFRTLALLLSTVRRRDLAQHMRGVFDLLARDNPFTSNRARRELDWSPYMTPDIGIPEAFAWWKKNHAATGIAMKASS
ncbi:MAG: NAD-dependent epimerase/dehydratase family protein [Gammaproteobacteria bacterium]|nr:NAD-dependent epimerase/dehydratase family protein [Gammaproteobacteria bacterium]